MISIGLTLLSCKRDPLDITPDGRLSIDDVFKTEIQTEAYLNTVYQSIPTYFNNYYQWAFLAGLTDEAKDAEIGNLSNSLSASWNNGSLTVSYNPLAKAGSGGSGQDRYVTFWTGIRDANVFLQYAPDVFFNDESKKERILSEAKLLRAFFYFELIKQFGAMPIVTKPFEPSFDYTQLVRPSFQECIDFIIKECDEVISENKLPIRIIQESERGRFTLAVAYSLKSQALLYNASPLWNPSNDKAKWQAAANASSIAIEKLYGTGIYVLAEDYGAYFLATSDLAEAPRDKETIFEIKNGSIPLTTTGIPSKEGSWTLGATPSQELVDAYDMQASGLPAILGYEDSDHLKPIINSASGYQETDPYIGRDPRFYATVWYNGAKYDNINGKVHTVETYIGGADQLLKNPPNRINTHTGYYLRKFIDPKLAVNQASSAKFKKYRLAELFLNYAEAENEANGPTQKAYDAINIVRKRAKMPVIAPGLNQVELRDRIRRERRVEFAWEEHRFWDVRRWKILGQTDRLVTGMEIKTSSNPGRVSITNAGFESGQGDWTLYSGAIVQNVVFHGGSNAASTAPTGGGYMAKQITVEPNTSYDLTAWFNVSSGVGYLGVNEYGGNELLVEAAASNSWEQKKVTFKTGATNTTAVIFSWWPNTGNGYLDDFSVFKSGSGGATGNSDFTFTRFVTERRNAWQDKFLIFPIPLTDASIIPDFRLNQNPGW